MAVDYQAIFGSDDYDPCAALQALRPEYMKAVASGGVERVRFRDRDVVYGRTSLAEFKALITQLESECAEKQGLPGKRRAITGGFRRAI